MTSWWYDKLMKLQVGEISPRHSAQLYKSLLNKSLITQCHLVATFEGDISQFCTWNFSLVLIKRVLHHTIFQIHSFLKKIFTLKTIFWICHPINVTHWHLLDDLPETMTLIVLTLATLGDETPIVAKASIISRATGSVAGSFEENF